MAQLDMIADRVIADGCSGTEQVTKTPVANRHVPGLIDYIKTMQCGGLITEIYVSTAASDPSGLPIYLEITQRNNQIPSFLNIGASVRSLVHRLGQPTARESDNLQYQRLDGEDSVTFRLKNGNVSSIRWDWYVD